MQSRIRLFLFALFTPLLCGVSFAFNPLSSYDNTSYNVLNSVGSLTYSIQQGKEYCVYVDSSSYYSTYNLKSNSTESWGCMENSFNIMGIDYFYCFTSCSSINGFYFNGSSNDSSIKYSLYEFDTGFVNPSSFEAKYDRCENELINCESDYYRCNDDLVSCVSNNNTLSGQLISCQSDLSSCTNGCDTMVAQCQENLSGCNADLSSMTNYKDSLEGQLQQCLAEIPEPCTGTGCEDISTGLNTVFSFFWERDDNMFSLPISNNIFLPRGIIAYIDSGVVALAEEEKQKIKIDEGFEVLTGTYYHFFIGIVMLGIFCLFAYYVKKFISKSFIPKEK